MTEETTGTPKFQAFYDWFNNLPSDSLGKEHWDALEVLIAALTTERDEAEKDRDENAVNGVKWKTRAEAVEAELDAAKRALAEMKLAQVEHDTLGCSMAKTGIYALATKEIK